MIFSFHGKLNKRAWLRFTKLKIYYTAKVPFFYVWKAKLIIKD